MAGDGDSTAMANKIMFIDDEPSVLDALTWMFMDEPYEFFSFNSPLKALEKLEETEFAVVISDQRMPEMDGTALLEKIRHKWPDTVRMLITAYQELDIATDAINKSNVYHLIYKPWNETELKKTVKRAVTYYESRTGNRKPGIPVGHEIKKEMGELKNQNQSLAVKNRYLIDRLTQSHKMETLGNLASGIAHDFKNILFIINGYLDLARLDPSCSPEISEKLNKALTASHRAKDLVTQILAFRRRNENSENSDHVVRVAPLVRDALMLLRAALPANIEIEQDIIADQETVRIDPTKLYQIIINLCANAAEAMESEYGVLRVVLDRATISAKSRSKMDLVPGRYLKLTVGDNGRGISPGSMPRIFDPFFTTKEESGGTGLGLALIDQIINAHGGKINVQSVLGQGSDFHVYLPLTGESVGQFALHKPNTQPMRPGHWWNSRQAQGIKD